MHFYDMHCILEYIYTCETVVINCIRRRIYAFLLLLAVSEGIYVNECL